MLCKFLIRLLSIWVVLQDVANVAKQQLQLVLEKAKTEKDAAVSKTVQTLQRRASKEALQQVCYFSALPGLCLPSPKFLCQ